MQDISIIICTYNGAERINKALLCIRSQNKLKTYVKEVIIVDNNSKDNTREVIERLSIDFPVAVRYVFEGKQGLSNARKRGIDACETKWIAFLDDDNLIEENWIEEVKNYIDSTKNIGAFNGAVIPKTSFEMTEDEKERLRASLKVLACTHYSKKELMANPHTPFRNPIGAGLVILSAPLKQLSNAGWLENSGRVQDNLASGEDGEMSYYVKKQGFEFGFCSKAILYHEMSKGRLDNDYLNRIWYAMGKGVAVVGRQQGLCGIKKYLYTLLLYVRAIAYSVQNRYKGKYYKRYIEGFKDEI